jgi:hypothetical protein
MSDSKEQKRTTKILKHPKRKLIWGLLFALVSVSGLAAASDVTEIVPSFFLFSSVALLLILGHVRDRRFLKSRSESELSDAKATLEENRGGGKTSGVSKKQTKMDIKQGNALWGKVLLESSFGLGTTYVYSNGYIYSTTRMRKTGPEKLLSISANTSLMNANPHAEEVWGGAMVSIQTESQVFTIKVQTDSKSLVFTPMDLKNMQELVMVGNSVINKG